MPNLQKLLDQFQRKIDDLETADDWHDNNRVMEAQTSIISEAEQLAKALRAVLEVADDMSDRADKTFSTTDRIDVEDGKAQAFLRAAVMVRNAIAYEFEDDDPLGADDD